MNTTARKRIKPTTIVWIVITVLVLGALTGILIAKNSAQNKTGLAAAPGPEAVQGQVVRPNSHVLSKAPEEKAVLVEFLDFECEACGSIYPFVEELRKEYGQNVTFVQRYFPLPGHRNSMNAAVAVEAAAEQGKYEQMYQKMFDTQKQWGESQDDYSELFRDYDKELGLDMKAYDASIADPATQQRVSQDLTDGKALGITGTPTFFLDGQLLQIQTAEQFEAAIKSAISK